MKGKYSKKKQKNTGFLWVLIVVVILILVIGGLWVAAALSSENDIQPPADTQIPETTSATETIPATTMQQASIEQGEEFNPMNLGYGIWLERVDGYTGIYMEDGSDQLVSGVMMILVTNNGEQDIQLMNIEVAYTNDTYNFILTNLPAGGSAVLLEQTRAPMPEGVPISALARNVVRFQEKMEVDTDTFEISGADGALNVKNISNADIVGSIYVYYKYKIQDVYYGGITFRVEIKDGLAAGEIRQIMTSHFNPDNCEVVMVEVVNWDGN